MEKDYLEEIRYRKSELGEEAGRDRRNDDGAADLVHGPSLADVYEAGLLGVCYALALKPACFTEVTPGQLEHPQTR